MNYRIVSFADLYSGQWIIVKDMRLIKTFTSVYEACRWVKTWGDDYNKNESELSWRAIERLK